MRDALLSLRSDACRSCFVAAAAANAYAKTFAVWYITWSCFIYRLAQLLQHGWFVCCSRHVSFPEKFARRSGLRNGWWSTPTQFMFACEIFVQAVRVGWYGKGLVSSKFQCTIHINIITINRQQAEVSYTTAVQQFYTAEVLDIGRQSSSVCTISIHKTSTRYQCDTWYLVYIYQEYIFIYLVYIIYLVYYIYVLYIYIYIYTCTREDLGQCLQYTPGIYIIYIYIHAHVKIWGSVCNLHIKFNNTGMPAGRMEKRLPNSIRTIYRIIDISINWYLRYDIQHYTINTYVPQDVFLLFLDLCLLLLFCFVSLLF